MKNDSCACRCRHKIRDLVDRAGRCASDYFLLLVRVVWGWQLAEAGWGKLHAIGKTAGFFQSLGIPAPTLNAWAAGSVECFGGALLVFGLGTRLVSIPVLFTMLVAVFTAHRADFLGTDKDPVTGIGHLTRFFDTTPGPFIITALILFCFGAGRFSLDAILAARCRKPVPDVDRTGDLPARPIE